jgi:hypothetical protein
MKALGWIALVLGIAAIGISVYGIVETYPNWKSMGIHDVVAAGQERINAMDRDLVTAYAKSVNYQHYGAWGAGVLALILGIVAFAKDRIKVGLAGSIFGLIGIALTFMTKV